MRIIRVGFVFVLAATASLAAQNGYKLFQQGLAKERAEGDLRGAIRIYERVVEDNAADHKLAAQALFRIGECQRALGNAEARKAYERIVRDYPDQKEVLAQAQARLVALRAPSVLGSPTYRRVWAYGDPEGTVSADGRYLSYPHWATGNLAIHDLVTGQDRVLTNKGANVYATGFCQETATSRSGKQVAYAWYVNDNGRYELRVQDAAGEGQPRRLYDNEDIFWIAPRDWSPDGKWIAVEIRRKDQTAQIGLVSTVDGSLKVLKSVDWDGTTGLWFSPDGKYLAYDLPVDETSRQRDVFVLATDGSRENPVAVHPANDAAAGWSPDGSHLLILSDRTGNSSLWSIPMADGRAAGDLAVVKHNLGTGLSLGVSSAGAFYFGSRTGDLDVQVASFDFSKGRLLSPPVKPITEFAGHNSWPSWSADGNLLAFVSWRGVTGDGKVIGVLDRKTGQVRVVRPILSEFEHPFWSPDGRSFALTGTDRKGRRGVFLVDAQNGHSSPIAISGTVGYRPTLGWSLDGKKVYYAKFQLNGRFTAVEHTLATGTEREIIQQPLGDPTLSPNGEWIATRAVNGGAGSQHWSAGGSQSLMLFPTAGGKPSEIWKAKGQLRIVSWTSDSASIIVSDGGKFKKVSIANGDVTDIDHDLGTFRRLAIHPDGRQIAYTTGNHSFEVWALEHFLPTQTASR